MKIGVFNASSQSDKNSILFLETKNAVKSKGYEVVNFGVFPEENANYSYIQIAICISILFECKAIDFVVTGCSSGTGMMLACNSLPSTICGYISNPTDAYLFGRINDGNAISYPLGLNFGWAAEINLRNTLQKLFEEPFGIGYPVEEADRKQKDTKSLKQIKNLAQKKFIDIISDLNIDLIKPVIARDSFYNYILENGQTMELIDVIKSIR